MTNVLLQEQVLQLHNDYRRIHNSPPLRLDATCTQKAKEYANKLFKKYKNIAVAQKQIRQEKSYGCNMYYGKQQYTMQYTDRELIYANVKHVMEYWYEQKKCYYYNIKLIPGHYKYVENFTQLVWKESKLLGVGIVFNQNAQNYAFVCIYNPKGNVEKKYIHNVLPPKEESQSGALPLWALHDEDSELQEHGQFKDEKLLRWEYSRGVSSARMRVWATWLSRICEITDEWQKCLRSNADLMTSMFEQIRKRKKIVSEEEPKEDLHVLPMTKDEIKLWDDFPYQAALYRTHYKHWKRIGQRSSARVVNRIVIDTEYGAARNDDAIHMMDISRQIAQYLMRQAESDVAHPTEETTEEASEAVTETSIGIDPTTDAPEQDFADMPLSKALSDDQSEEVVEISVAEETSETEAKSAKEEKSNAREKEPMSETAMGETPASETATGEEIPTSETMTGETSANETATKEEIRTSETATEEETPTSKTAAAIEVAKAIEPSVSITSSEIVVAISPLTGIEKRKAVEKLIKDTGDYTEKAYYRDENFFLYLRPTKADQQLVEQHTDVIKKRGLERIYDVSRGTWLYYNLSDQDF